MVEGVGFEPTYAKRPDLQSGGFNHSPTPPQVLYGDISARSTQRKRSAKALSAGASSVGERGL